MRIGHTSGKRKKFRIIDETELHLRSIRVRYQTDLANRFQIEFFHWTERHISFRFTFT